MEYKADTKELDEMLDSVFQLMDGKEATFVCATLGRALGIMWGYLSAKTKTCDNEALEALFAIIRKEITRTMSLVEQEEYGFKMNQ